MNGHGKSHSSVVPAKSPNNEGPERSASQGESQTGTNRETGETAKGEPKATAEGGHPTAEGVEGRELAKGNLPQQNMPRAQDRVRMPSALERIGQVARRDRKVRFTTLMHHVYNLDTLREAYFGLKRDAAPGVEGEAWREYGEQLEEKLRDLSERLKRGAYRAKPVRRVFIPKADGGMRPLGVTTLGETFRHTEAGKERNAAWNRNAVPHERRTLIVRRGFIERPRRFLVSAGSVRHDPRERIQRHAWRRDP
jgi:hypothetical protein